MVRRRTWRTKRKYYNRVGHHNLCIVLVGHIFNAKVNPVVDNFEDDFDNTDDELDMFVDDSGEDYDDMESNDD